MYISRYFVFFILFSFLGWIYETIYSILKEKKWENRGFLFGPVCPIYGAGGIAAAIIVEHLSWFGRSDLNNWEIFVLSFIGSFFLEYGTSWLLEKLFNAYWWDYSNIPFNIKGRVCLPASIGFGAAGIFITRCLVPAMQKISLHISPIMMEILALFFMGLLACDLTLTVSVLTSFQRNVLRISDALNNHMDELVEDLKEKNPISQDLVLKMKAAELHESMDGVYRKCVERMKGVRYPKVDMDKIDYIFKAIKGGKRR